MNNLTTFRSTLRWLKLQRAMIRWQTALGRCLLLTIATLFVLFLLDYAFRPEMSWRAVLLGCAAIAVLWRIFRDVAPQLLQHESIIDVTILLERANGVESDLVAALQFEAAGNASAGSVELQEAVVARAAALSKNFDTGSVVPKDDVRRASWRAAFAIALVALLWFALPHHANAFWNRMCLGNLMYPTWTIIEEVTINERTDEARVVEGESIQFRVRCSGVLPDEGIVTLHGVETGDSTTVVLHRVEESEQSAIYSANGPMLNETVEYSLRIGDAKTTPHSVTLIRRPIVELTICAVAPNYMREEPVEQRQHIAEVIEGSAVALSIQSTNNKRLVEARFELASGVSIAMRPTDKAGMSWQLVNASQLQRIDEDISFRIIVEDEDGLTTLRPLEGTIRVKRDQPPTSSIATTLYTILPNARPTIRFTIEDEFGIGSIVLHARRATGSETLAASAKDASFEISLPESGGTTIHGKHRLDLSQLDLALHDKLLVWLETTDDRGDWPGVTSLSEVIELDVVDQRGVLEEILRSDEDAEQLLTDVIEKELGLEGNSE